MSFTLKPPFNSIDRFFFHRIPGKSTTWNLYLKQRWFCFELPKKKSVDRNYWFENIFILILS